MSRFPIVANGSVKPAYLKMQLDELFSQPGVTYNDLVRAMQSLAHDRLVKARELKMPEMATHWLAVKSQLSKAL